MAMHRKEMTTWTSPLQPQVQQRQQPEPPPFPVKRGFLKGTGGMAVANAKTAPSKPRCRKVGARCRFEGCTGRPWFAQPGSRVPRACKAHKEEGEVNVYAPACEADGCTTRPHYGVDGGRARFCCKHKLDGMVDVLNKRCATKGCRRQPSWARERGARALFCKEHKEDGMVDTKHKTCLHPGCTRFPSKSGAAATTMPHPSQENAHGPTQSSPAPAETAAGAAAGAATAAVHPGPARYCAAHAPTGAANVTASRCRHPGGCSVQPYFGREGGGQQPEFCALHRKPGMTDIRNPRCAAVGCAAQPRCGPEGDPRPTFCLRHAEPDMVNFRSAGYRDRDREQAPPPKRRKAAMSSPAPSR
ncbi:unnamed protein product [Ectocarpus fasciculatus]